MADKEGYTPTPWEVDPDYDWVRDENGKVVANCTGHDSQRANAQRICACVNGCQGLNPSAYKEVVEACKMLIEHMTIPIGAIGRPYLADVKRATQQALAKAEEK